MKIKLNGEDAMIDFDDKVCLMCDVCGEVFEMGWNGIWLEDKPTCDKCAGVERDAEGNAWLPGETEHVYEDVETGQEFEVSREEAFGKGEQDGTK